MAPLVICNARCGSGPVKRESGAIARNQPIMRALTCAVGNLGANRDAAAGAIATALTAELLATAQLFTAGRA